MRRRQRRLRQWHRHERMTVAMALAEATHHAAPRGPKTARAGVRPGVLEDPGPRRETEHEQHAALRGPKPPSPGVPSLAMPVLAGTAGEAVDRTALSYLLQQSLAATKEEEKEERKLVELEVKRKEAELQSLAAATREMVQQRTVGSSAWTSTLARSVQLRDELRELRGEKRKKRKKRKKKLPKTSSGYGRPCDHQRQVPAVHAVRERGGAPVPVLRQCGGHSCYACRDVYPQFVLCRRLSCFYWCCSWTVPLPDIGGVGFGSSPNLDTMHTIFELCLPSERGCVAISCGGGFCSPDCAYDSVWDKVKPMTGNFFFNFFQYQEFVGFVCMLNYWFSNNDTICADIYFFPVHVEGKCRSEKLELYLYGHMTIKVDRDTVEVLPRGVPPPRFFTLLGNGSHTFFGLCLPFERGMGMSMPLAVPVLSGNFSGTCVSTVPAVEPAAMSFTFSLTGCIDATAAVVSKCFASADCTDSVTPMGSAGTCVAMSCDGGSFTSDGAYNSLWVAMPMKGNTPSFSSCTKTSLGVFACTMTGSAALTIFAPTTTTPSSSS